MDYTCFEVDLSEKVAHIQLNRPEAFNSMVPEFWTELPAIVEEFDASGEARAIVISSKGKHFTAGMDLAVFGSGGLESEERAERGRRRADFVVDFSTCRIPSAAWTGPGCRCWQPYRAGASAAEWI